MLYEYIYVTIAESYLLIFMGIYTIAHIFYTRILKPPLKLKEGVSYDLDFVLNDNSNILTEYAFHIMSFNMIALPIAALSMHTFLGIYWFIYNNFNNSFFQRYFIRLKEKQR